MSRLTVTEKEHWKERIELRVSKAMAALEAQDPTLMLTIRAQAEERAHEALGTLDFQRKVATLRRQIKSLEVERDQTERAMLLHSLGPGALLRGEYHAREDFASQHGRHTARLEDELLKDSPLGRQILKLRAEKDALLDTVWLATYSAQVRDLWSRVSTVLGEEVTPLQQQILLREEQEVAKA